MHTFPAKLVLELQVEPDPAWKRQHRKEFAGMARELGLELRPILLPNVADGSAIPDQYLEDVKSAAAYWIRPPHLLGHTETRDVVLRKLQRGEAWVILSFDRNYLTDQNAFLKPFGVAGTMVGAFRHAMDSRPIHQRVVFLDRGTHSSSFRDSLLFSEVNELALDSPQGLVPTGKAQAVLAIPDRHAELIDTSKDLFTDWPTPEFPCMAVWRPTRGHGGLLVLGADLVADPWVTLFGESKPGITGADNRQFARNLLRLIADLPAPRVFDWSAAHGLLCQIETNMFTVTSHALKRSFGANWWDAAVPEKIREKCERRKQDELGQFPVPAYLELLDYKKIWSKHWHALTDAAAERGKTIPEQKVIEALIERIHPVRKKSAHPTKVAAIGQSRPTSDEQHLLEQAANQLLELYAAVCGLTHA